MHKDYDIVEVEWLDASNNPGFLDINDAKATQNLICFNVGYLLREDNHSIRLAASVVPSLDEAGKLMEIPSGMIKKLTVLRKAKK